MWEFVRENAVWVTPVLVAIVSGMFLLLSKKGRTYRKNKQVVKDVHNSTIIQNNTNDGD